MNAGHNSQDAESPEPDANVFVPGRRRRRATFSECWRIWTAMAFVWPLQHALPPLFRSLHHPLLTDTMAKFLAVLACFLAGLAWHWWHPERRRLRLNVAVVLVCGLICASILLAGALAFKGLSHLRPLTSLQEDSLEQITVIPWLAERYFGSLEIRDKEALREFALCARDATPHSDERCRPVSPMWYLRVDGEQRVELMCYYQEEWPDSVVGEIGYREEDPSRFVIKTRFVSRNLRPWFEKHVENTKADPDGQETGPPVR